MNVKNKGTTKDTNKDATKHTKNMINTKYVINIKQNRALSDNNSKYTT